MKKVLLKALIPALSIVLLVMFGCSESEKIVKACSGDDYKITTLTWAKSSIGYHFVSQADLTIYAPNGASVFPENLNISIFRRQGTNAAEVKANEPSPKKILSYDTYDDAVISINIKAASCSNTIEKTEEEVTNNTTTLCNGQVEIVAITCENIVKFTWQSKNSLTGISLNAYGKTVDLGSASSATFDKSSLDLNADSPSLTNANKLCLLFAATACTGNTGTLAISPNIEAGQNLTVTVTDADLNTSETTAETVTVAVTTSKNQSKNVTLTETGVSTGIFSATLSTVLGKDAGTANDGTLVIENGTVITVTYDDVLDGNLNDPAAISQSVTATGASAPVGTAVIYNGQTYYLTDASYQPLEFESPFKTWFTLANADHTFAIELVLSYVTNSLADGTYAVGGSGNIVVVASSESGATVGTDGNEFKEFTSGTCEVTVGESSYTLEMNLQTSLGPLTGTYVVPF